MAQSSIDNEISMAAVWLSVGADEIERLHGELTAEQRMRYGDFNMRAMREQASKLEMILLGLRAQLPR